MARSYGAGAIFAQFLELWGRLAIFPSNRFTMVRRNLGCRPTALLIARRAHSDRHCCFHEIVHVVHSLFSVSDNCLAESLGEILENYCCWNSRTHCYSLDRRRSYQCLMSVFQCAARYFFFALLADVQRRCEAIPDSPTSAMRLIRIPSRHSPPCFQDETYDVIICGTGLKACSRFYEFLCRWQTVTHTGVHSVGFAVCVGQEGAASRPQRLLWR